MGSDIFKLLLLFVVVGIVGTHLVSKSNSTEPAAPPVGLVDPNTTFKDWPQRPLRFSLETPFTNYQKQITGLFAKGDLATIETKAQQARTQRERLLGSRWALDAIYKGVTEIPWGKGQTKLTNTDWLNHINRLRAWNQQMPNSITAKTALAVMWCDFAWEARGTCTADKVSDENWRLFKERLTEAHRVIEASTDFEAKCPHWYAAALTVGLGLSWDRATIDQLFAAGKKLEPHYPLLYIQKAVYLLPQWNGQDDEWVDFLDQECSSLEPEEGAILYFVTMAELLRFCCPSVGNTRIARFWPKMKEGFYVIEKKYGLNVSRMNEGCYYATFGLDQFFAHRLFGFLGDKRDLSIWKSQKQYDDWKKIAATYVANRTPAITGAN